MRKGFINLALLLVGAALVIGGGIYLVNKYLSQTHLGSFTPVQGQKTTLSGAGIGTTDTSINLSSLKTPSGYAIQMADFGGVIGYATIDPGTSKEENISFAGITQNANGTAQLTTVTRGLNFVAPYNSSTSLAYAHSGGATLILSNSAAFYSQFNIAASTSTISGNWTYNSSSLPKVSGDTPNNVVGNATATLATVGYVNSVASSGAANASSATAGLVQFGSLAQIASGTNIGSTGAGLVPLGQMYGASSTSRTQIPVTRSNGTLDPTFYVNNANTWAATSTFASTTIFNGSTTINFAPTTSTDPVRKGYADPLMQFISAIAPAATTTTSGATVDVATASSTFTLTTPSRVMVVFTGTIKSSGAGANPQVFVSVDAADTLILNLASPTASDEKNASFTYITPTQLTAASHTVKIRMNASGGGTVTITPAQLALYSMSN